jgi:hypothetical protein
MQNALMKCWNATSSGAMLKHRLADIAVQRSWQNKNCREYDRRLECDILPMSSKQPALSKKAVSII